MGRILTKPPRNLITKKMETKDREKERGHCPSLPLYCGDCKHKYGVSLYLLDQCCAVAERQIANIENEINHSTQSCNCTFVMSDQVNMTRCPWDCN